MPSHRPWALVLGLLVLPATSAEAQRAVFVVRHAERADAGMQASKDPALSAAGETRARRLAEMLANVGATALYATEYRRTVLTLEPLARRVGIEVQQIPAADTTTLVQRIRTSGPDAVVVVAGHSNTVPAILSALGTTEPVTIDDAQYDDLFIVVPAGDGPVRLLRLKY